MKLTIVPAQPRRMKADVVALLVHEDAKSIAAAIAPFDKLLGGGGRIKSFLRLEEFKGKKKELASFVTGRTSPAPRIVAAGCGPGSEALEPVRRAAAAAAREAERCRAARMVIVVPSGTKDPAAAAGAAAEGALLSLYRYDRYLTEKKRKPSLKEIAVALPQGAEESALRRELSRRQVICEATAFARDLANAPGNDMYPETLAAAARESASRHGYRATIWDNKRIAEAGFGGLLAVNAGSTRPARFIILEHNSGEKSLPTVVLVGKGITFDAGGISIKPAGGMGEMKMDMSGAAAVIGAMEAAARLKLPLHLVGLVPSTENLLGGAAMRPGDIITHYGGKTSEVDNTDAEGRLVLADALGYAATYKPAAVIDLATLTGACVVALGHHATGMMGNDAGLMRALKDAGETTFERVWELPLYEEYEPQIKSDVADVKNTGGRWGGAITAGLFLKKFIADYKWVHLDIAGPAILEENFPYAPKGASGVGVRLLIEFLRSWKP